MHDLHFISFAFIVSVQCLLFDHDKGGEKCTNYYGCVVLDVFVFMVLTCLGCLYFYCYFGLDIWIWMFVKTMFKCLDILRNNGIA